MALQTVSQRRAAHAWKSVQFVKDQGEAAAKEYQREAKKLPVRIMASGLGQSLAFIFSKAKDKKPALKHLQAHLAEWVVVERPVGGKHKDSLLRSVIEGDSDYLRRATDEALAYLLWLNRFLEAELGSVDPQDGQEN